MKKIIFILIIILLLITVNNVNATASKSWTYDYVGDSKMSESGAVFSSKEEAKKYIPYTDKSSENYTVMCKYQRESLVSGTGTLQGSANFNSHNKFVALSISILYFDNSTFQVVWNYTENGFYYEYGSPVGTVSEAFDKTQGARAQDVVKISDGECPLYAYIDEANYDGNEVCFDNNGEFCKTDDDWDAGTSFYTGSNWCWPMEYNYYKSDFGTRFGEIEAINTGVINYYNVRNSEMENMLELNVFTYEEYPDYCATEPDGLGTVDYNFNSKVIKATNGVYHYLKIFDDDEIINYMTGIPNILKYSSYKTKFNDLKSNFTILKSTADANCQKLRMSLYDRGLITEAQNNLMALQQDAAKAELEAAINSFTSGTFIEPIKVKLDFTPVIGCAGYLGSDTVDLLNNVYSVIKYVSIIILLVLSIVDFLKALVSHDKELVIKASKSSVTRICIGVLIFFLPLILDVFLKLIGITEGVCGIGV